MRHGPIWAESSRGLPLILYLRRRCNTTLYCRRMGNGVCDHGDLRKQKKTIPCLDAPGCGLARTFPMHCHTGPASPPFASHLVFSAMLLLPRHIRYSWRHAILSSEECWPRMANSNHAGSSKRAGWFFFSLAGRAGGGEGGEEREAAASSRALGSARSLFSLWSLGRTVKPFRGRTVKPTLTSESCRALATDSLGRSEPNLACCSTPHL